MIVLVLAGVVLSVMLWKTDINQNGDIPWQNINLPFK